MYANDDRPAWLKKLDDLEKKADSLADLPKRVSELEARSNGLEAQVRVLKKASKGYLDVRRRYLEVYKREYMGKEGLHELGNKLELEADIRTDSYIFEEDKRSDQRFFRHLYLVDSRQAAALDCETTGSDHLLTLLDQRATALTQGFRIPAEIEKMFTILIGLVEDADLRPDFSNHTDIMGSTYSQLRMRWNDHQRWINEERRNRARLSHS